MNSDSEVRSVITANVSASSVDAFTTKLGELAARVSIPIQVTQIRAHVGEDGRIIGEDDKIISLAALAGSSPAPTEPSLISSGRGSLVVVVGGAAGRLLGALAAFHTIQSRLHVSQSEDEKPPSPKAQKVTERDRRREQENKRREEERARRTRREITAGQEKAFLKQEWRSFSHRR